MLKSVCLCFLAALISRCSGQKPAFVASPLFHNRFDNTTKCSNRAYTELFSVTEDKSVVRAHGFLFSELVFVGNVTKKTTNPSSFDIVVQVSCVLKGKLNGGVMKVVNMAKTVPETGVSSSGYCFPFNEEINGRQVLVFGNMLADQTAVQPLEGGVSLLGMSDYNAPEYAALQCTPEVQLSPSTEGSSFFCSKLPEGQCDTMDAYTTIRAKQDLQDFRWADLGAALVPPYSMLAAEEFYLPAYEFDKYQSAFTTTTETPKTETQKPSSRRGRKRGGPGGYLTDFPKGSELRDGDGKVIFRAASVQQMDYMRRKMFLVNRILGVLKRTFTETKAKK